MVRKLIHRALAARHPWRVMTFSELAEIYIAVFMRTFAMGMIGIFIPAYLLGNGYSLTWVLAYFLMFYLLGPIYDVITAYMISYFGPKHVMRLSFLLQIILSLLLINLEALPYPIIILSIVGSAASTTFFLPYFTDFSKAKHPDHSGKEVGFMNAMERIATIAGPFAGGIIATIWGAHVIFWIATGALTIGMVVLMLAPEYMQTRRKPNWKGLNIRKNWRNHLAYGMYDVEYTASNGLWQVFLAAVVFSGGVYLKIGSVASLPVLVAALVAVPLGRMLDKQKGGKMLRYGSLFNAFGHLLKPTITGVTGGLVLSAINEPIKLVYRMAFFKAFFDEADSKSALDQRVSYIAVSEIIGDGFRIIFWLALVILSLFTSAYIVCLVGFVMAAIASVSMRVERFPALR